MSSSLLSDAVADPVHRRAIALDAVDEAAAAIRARRGLGGLAAATGLQTIHRLRPGFLANHIEQLLPGMAEAVDPWWAQGLERGNAIGWLEEHRHEVAEALLAVTDGHVASASDATAIAVYQRLRGSAPKRIANEMPRIAAFIACHTA